MEMQQIKFYQTGTFTVGNRLLDADQRSVQANMQRTNSLNSGHRACQGCGDAPELALTIVDNGVGIDAGSSNSLPGRSGNGLALPSAERIRTLADRRRGIGFDQLLWLEAPRRAGDDVGEFAADEQMLVTEDSAFEHDR